MANAFMMMVSGGEWDEFLTEVRAWGSEFYRAHLAENALQRINIVTWRNPSLGHFSFASAPEVAATETTAALAFHLNSFPRVASAFFRLSLGRLSGRAVGPANAPRMLNLEDFMLRAFCAATKIGLNGHVAYNEYCFLEQWNQLRVCLELSVANMEALSLLRNVQLKANLELDENVVLRPLTDAELLELVQLGFVSPRFEFLSPSSAPIGCVDFKHTARIALIRLIPERNVAHGASEPEAISEIIAADIKRLADAVAIAADRTFVHVGWRARAAEILSSGCNYTVRDSYQPKPYDAELSVDVDFHAVAIAQRWRQLVRAEETHHGRALRLAARLVGHAAARTIAEHRVRDAVTALEAMLISEENGGRAVKRTLIDRAALVLGPTDGVEKTRTMKKTLDGVYKIRSLVGHGKHVNDVDVVRAGDSAMHLGQRILGFLLDQADVKGNYDFDWSGMSRR